MCGPVESGTVHKGEQSLFISLSCGDEEEGLKIMLVARVQELHSPSPQNTLKVDLLQNAEKTSSVRWMHIAK